MTNKCPVCGAVFETRSKYVQICSDECRKQMKRLKARQSAAELKSTRPKPYDADGRHRRFRERAMKAKPWKYEFADSPELLS